MTGHGLLVCLVAALTLILTAVLADQAAHLLGEIQALTGALSTE